MLGVLVVMDLDEVFRGVAFKRISPINWIVFGTQPYEQEKRAEEAPLTPSPYHAFDKWRQEFFGSTQSNSNLAITLDYGLLHWYHFLLYILECY
jgi:hypothetical protein